jgi:hypothetical protein
MGAKSTCRGPLSRHVWCCLSYGTFRALPRGKNQDFLFYASVLQKAVHRTSCGEIEVRVATPFSRKGRLQERKSGCRAKHGSHRVERVLTLAHHTGLGTSRRRIAAMNRLFVGMVAMNVTGQLATMSSAPSHPMRPVRRKASRPSRRPTMANSA